MLVVVRSGAKYPVAEVVGTPLWTAWASPRGAVGELFSKFGTRFGIWIVGLEPPPTVRVLRDGKPYRPPGACAVPADD